MRKLPVMMTPLRFAQHGHLQPCGPHAPRVLCAQRAQLGQPDRRARHHRPTKARARACNAVGQLAGHRLCRQCRQARRQRCLECSRNRCQDSVLLTQIFHPPRGHRLMRTRHPHLQQNQAASPHLASPHLHGNHPRRICPRPHWHRLQQKRLQASRRPYAKWRKCSRQYQSPHRARSLQKKTHHLKEPRYQGRLMLQIRREQGQCPMLEVVL